MKKGSNEMPKGIKRPDPPPAPPKKVESLPYKTLIRPDEAAAYFSVTRRTIHKWCERGHLEAVKIAGTVRVTRVSVLSYEINLTE